MNLIYPVVYTSAKEQVFLEKVPLAPGGGEGSVYGIISANKYAESCVKIYHEDKRTTDRREKVEFMVQNKPKNIISDNYIICWPTEIVFDSYNNFLGFIMPLAFSGSEKLYELTTATDTPERLSLSWSKFNRSTASGIEKRYKVCVNIAIAIHTIHQCGQYVIVDYKPHNILITHDGRISVIDVDSFQISSNSIVLFHSEVRTAEYSPSESIRLNPSRDFIPECWDRFSLAVSFYEIIFGIHPYGITCNGQYQEIHRIDESIQNGLFVHGSKRNYVTVIPPLHDNYFNAPASLRSLFYKAFDNGLNNCDARPTAEEWGLTIHEELQKKVNILAHTISGPEKQKKQQLIEANEPSLKTSNTINNDIPTKQVIKNNKSSRLFALSLLLAIIFAFAISAFNDQAADVPVEGPATEEAPAAPATEEAIEEGPATEEETSSQSEESITNQTTSDIAGNYSGIASTGKLVTASIRVYGDGITVTSYGQTVFMTKYSDGLYINQQGEKCFFEEGKMFVIDNYGNSYFLVLQN